MRQYQLADKTLTLVSTPPPKAIPQFAKIFGIRSFRDLMNEGAVVENTQFALCILDLQVDQLLLNQFLAMATDCKTEIDITAIDNPEILSEILRDFFSLCVERYSRGWTSTAASAIPN